MRVFVTGASGFMGTAVVKELPVVRVDRDVITMLGDALGREPTADEC